MTILSTPKYIPTLRTSGVLTSVTVRVPSFSIVDKAVTDEITTEKNASNGAGRYTKSLFAGNKAYEALPNYRSIMDNWHKQITLCEWGGDMRYLPKTKLAEFQEQFAAHKAEFDKRKEVFFSQYDEAIGQQAFVHGKTFNRADYPTVEELRNSGRFGIEVYIQEVPEGDFRNTIGIDAVGDVMLDVERQAARYVQGMAQQSLANFKDVMKSLINATRIETTMGEDGKVKVSRGRLYEATFQRAKQYCDLMDDYNLTDDPTLAELRDEIRRVLGDLTVEAVRESDTKRVTIHEELSALRDKLNMAD
jgi:hypothetical protein